VIQAVNAPIVQQLKHAINVYVKLCSESESEREMGRVSERARLSSTGVMWWRRHLPVINRAVVF